MKSTIIYLIGHYAVGKLTIARAIETAANARVFDNHLANNVIFSLIRADGRTPMPKCVWDMVDVIRDQALLAIEELASMEASFVLTNCLLEGEAADRVAYEKVEQLALRRQSVFVPVMLTASNATHAERMASPERAERLKMTDALKGEDMRKTAALLHVDHPNRLDIDTTDLPPAEAAQIIIAHAKRLG